MHWHVRGEKVEIESGRVVAADAMLVVDVDTAEEAMEVFLEAHPLPTEGPFVGKLEWHIKVVS